MEGVEKSLPAKVERALFLTFVTAVYIFLLLPLVIVVIASFNSEAFLTFPPHGFSLRWYAAFFNSEPFMDSLLFSLELAAVASVVSTLLGSCSALYVVRFAGAWRNR